MSKKLKNIFSVSLVIALSVNFFLFSSQSYSPPRAESISYSITNCPTHEGGHHATSILKLFLGSDSEHGSKKDCFCYDCCSQRVSYDVLAQSFYIVLEQYSTTLEILDESIHIADSYKNLPIRSPPDQLV